MRSQVDGDSVCAEQQQYLIGQTNIMHFVGQWEVFHAYNKSEVIDLTSLKVVSWKLASAAEAYVQPRTEIKFYKRNTEDEHKKIFWKSDEYQVIRWTADERISIKI